MTRAERNEKLHQEAIARQLGRRYGKLTVIAYDKSVKGNLGYSPENCRWVDIATQNRNRRKREAEGLK